jgi:hypothetical protein
LNDVITCSHFFSPFHIHFRSALFGGFVSSIAGCPVALYRRATATFRVVLTDPLCGAAYELVFLAAARASAKESPRLPTWGPGGISGMTNRLARPELCPCIAQLEAR